MSESIPAVSGAGNVGLRGGQVNTSMESREPTEVFTLTFTPMENFEQCTSLDCVCVWGGVWGDVEGQLPLLFSCKLHQILATPAVL